MRISDSMTQMRSMDGVKRSRGRMEELQTKMGTMKEINRPSDDPVGNVTLMEARKFDKQVEYFNQAASLAKSFLENSESAISELNDILIRLKELTLAQASSSAGPEQRDAVSKEVEQLLSQVKGISNRRVGDRYIFSGYKTSEAPFDDRGNYRGDGGLLQVEITPGNFVGMNLPGNIIFLGDPIPGTASSFLKPEMLKKPEGEKPVVDPQGNELRAPAGYSGDLGISNEEFGAPPKPAALNLFQTIDNIRIALQTNDQKSLQDILPNLDRSVKQVIDARATIGARIQTIDAMQESLGRDQLSNAKVKSQIEDLNFDKAASDLSREESILRATMASAAKVVQPQLLDFLR